LSPDDPLLRLDHWFTILVQDSERVLGASEIFLNVWFVFELRFETFCIGLFVRFEKRRALPPWTISSSKLSGT